MGGKKAHLRIAVIVVDFVAAIALRILWFLRALDGKRSKPWRSIGGRDSTDSTRQHGCVKLLACA
jgi:hypothetical protein